jgi:hypothetical protein
VVWGDDEGDDEERKEKERKEINGFVLPFHLNKTK